MLQRYELKGLIRPLEEMFKFVDSKEIDVLHEVFQGETIERMRLAVRFLIENHKYPSFPSVAEIKDALVEIRGEVEPRGWADADLCGLCSQDGYRVTGTLTVRYCDCSRGQRLREAHRRRYGYSLDGSDKERKAEF